MMTENKGRRYSVDKAEGGAMRGCIENIIGIALVGISMLVQIRYIQKTQYLIYAFFIFFIVVIILHTIEAVVIKKYDRKTYGNIRILLCVSLLSELPVIRMYRNSLAANQQEITNVVRTLIFIVVLQIFLSAALSFAYRKNTPKK
ncbi:MAG: hypothetical protein JNG50_05930 [Mogibacterium sp.]|uniref:hypothetical protein n=1 Tax=Mogibacterium sp. TaxID=2049035 RepID=UPI001A61F7D3|nr:hypothetical protein [Mogibacterium sp.]MBL6469023.1 hypothetical protein [Mogibacterium sp.]